MNLSIQEELQPFAEELQHYITPDFLEELAREMKFVKRKRKFSGWVFLPIPPKRGNKDNNTLFFQGVFSC